MSRPVGSKNKPKEPTPVLVLDGYLNAVTGSGTRKDSSSFTRIKGAYLLQEQELNDLYIGNGFARKIVDVVAEEMTRSGIHMDGLEDEALEEFVDSRLDELDAFRHANDAVRWSRLFGGGVMIYGLNDGATLDVPLSPGNIKSVEFLRVYDRYAATIQTRNTDPMSPDYGKPELWQITPKEGGVPYTVHNSRLHVFDGESLPDGLRQSNLGWGASSLQACKDELIRLGSSHQNASMLLERSQQAVHKIPGLTNILRAPGGEAAIQRRVDVVDMVRSLLNTIVIDGEEDYVVSTQSLMGVPDVLDRFAEAVAALAGMPVSKFMGRAPGGLNSTGKGDDDTWNARIESMWNDILRKPLDRLITYIIMAKQGTAPSYKLCMNPLSVMSEAEQATVNQTNANAAKLKSDAATAYSTIGAIDPDEIRATLEDEYQLPPNSAAPGPVIEPESTDVA